MSRHSDRQRIIPEAEVAKKTAAVAGINMRWDEEGDGTPIVLIHGIPTGPALWRHVLPRISNVRVWGAADQFQKAEYGERFARDLSAPLRRIEQGRHFTPEDHPEIVAHEINQLLADVQQGSRKR